jgi:hypothetical protein
MPNAPPVTSSAANEEQDIGDFQPEEEASIGDAVYDPYKGTEDGVCAPVGGESTASGAIRTWPLARRRLRPRGVRR